jgi:glutamate/tyrosine decarboxylase-like PLP-dependent enzyme
VLSRLPDEGRSWSDIRSDLLAGKADDYDWRRGRVPLYVYHDSDELLAVSREAYALYFSENALGERAFPSLARMQEEVVSMVLSVFHAPPGAVGSFTSGGTESLFLALKTARDWFRATRPEVRKPMVVLPRTAHPAFDKAAHYLDVEIVRTDIGADLRCDISALQAAVNERTMLIAASAPCYPYGVFDPIARLGELAAAKRVWFHVDACLGGFLAPFARDEGFPIPEFDFVIPGVTSLSADLHKYGFSAKGASVLIYREADLWAHQAFHFDNWPRGGYSTDTFLGTRPGGPIASAWAVMQFLGRAGYRRLARKTMETKQRLVEGIETIPELEVIRPTELSIVVYRSRDPRVDINAVADVLGEAGWFIGRSREPQGLHVALNAVHAPAIDQYLHHLKAAVRRVRMSGRLGTYDDRTY